jgi:hypothetical protein
MADKTVLIACKQRRGGGSKIPLLGLTVHFKVADDQKDNPEAEHVAAVPFARADVIYRLLAIKEGFHLVDPDAELPPRPAKAVGVTVAIGNQPAVAEKKPILISDGEKEINLAELSAEELRILARDTFKIAVHHKWPDQTVIAKIIEKTRGE